jgi:bacillithiol biosynthesis cysteine-adding enzyme BshC
VTSEPASTSSTAFRQPIDFRRFPGSRRLLIDYSAEYSALADFYAGDPTQPGAWRRAIVRAQSHSRPRAEIAQTVRAQVANRGAPIQAITAADRLRDARTVAVVTGQQAGLFGGPLYTLYKALAAVRLAEAVERDHHVPCVAIFWVESEDHDWEEVRHAKVLDADQNLRTVSLDTPEHAGERPVASVRLDRSVESALASLTEALPNTDFSARLLEQLRDTYRIGTGMAEAFARWLDVLLGSRGLVVFDAADAAAKPFVASLFGKELASAGETAALAGRAGVALADRGYHVQVVPTPDSVALFQLDGARRAIRRRPDGFVIGETLHRAEALENEARTSPARFSPNVLLRPVVQDTLFPTVAYVSGPNELAYLGQLRGVYDRYSVPMPLVYPRPSLTVLDAAAVRFLARYDISIEAFQPQDDGPLNRLLEAQLPAEVERAFEAAEGGVRERLERLAAAVRSVDPTLEGAVRSTLGRISHDLESLHAKIIQAAKRKDDTLRRQFLRTRAQIFPGGEPQERVLGFLTFLNRYGPAFVDRLLADLPLAPGQHWLISL